MLAKEDDVNQVANQQQVLVTTESHTMNVDLYSATELHSSAKLQNEVEAHSNSKIRVHERDIDLLDKEVNSDSEVERPNEENRIGARLYKYVERHHPVAQIIGDKDDIPMTRNKLRNDTCFLSMQEPKQ